VGNSSGRITSAKIEGKSKAEVEEMIRARMESGKLTESEIAKARTWLTKLAKGEVLTDAQMIAKLKEDLGFS
jgi:hypothetical protein